MIINENEKNRIKSLYGLLTESAPPEENVLVANKNPFKYEEYKNARKFYNSNLKDGDLFFKIKGESGWKNGMTDYLSSKIKQNFDGKTIRWNDNIGKLRFEENNNIFVKSEGETGTQSILGFYINLQDENGRRIGEIVFNPRDGFKELKRSRVDYEKYNKNPSGSLPLKDEFITISIQNNDSMKTLVFSFSNWNVLPDEFFEIRKIQRQKTDF
jgi:hypothetical protein